MLRGWGLRQRFAITEIITDFSQLRIFECFISICHNTLGSFHCECEEGYEGNGLLDCYVIDRV